MSCVFFDVPEEIYNKLNCNTCPVRECCRSLMTIDEAVMDICRECIKYAFRIQEELRDDD